MHPAPAVGRAVALLGDTPRVDHLSVRQTLAGKHILLIGVTGFIGKVWLVDLLENIPDIGKITLLIRRNRTTSGQRRFEKIVEESPTLDVLQENYGRKLGAFLKEKVEVVEGDVSQPGLGMDPEDASALEEIARPGREQRGADGFQSRFARCDCLQRGFDAEPARFSAADAITPD